MLGLSFVDQNTGNYYLGTCVFVDVADDFKKKKNLLLLLRYHGLMNSVVAASHTQLINKPFMNHEQRANVYNSSVNVKCFFISREHFTRAWSTEANTEIITFG